jgi:glycosyltransferase involved in cell wall biosynthesis
MNILCLHPVLSMRAIKEMAVVKASGHRVILAYEGIGSSASVDKGEFWDKEIKLEPAKSKLEFVSRRIFPVYYKAVLRRIIKEERIDIVHVFSMPDNLAVAAVRYASVPVIYDIRDLTTGMNMSPFIMTRFPFLNKLQEYPHRSLQKRFESIAVNQSNGVVCVSECMADKVVELYKISRKKITFLESFPTTDAIPENNNDKLSKNGGIHLVYAGNLFFDGLENSVSFIKQIADEQLHIHIYPIGLENQISLTKEIFRYNKFIHFYEPKKFEELFADYNKYDYGLVLYSPKEDQLNRSLTISNKLLEYLACGIPVACTDLEAPKLFLRKHNVGFVFSDARDLAKKIKNSDNTFTIRQHEFLMENHIFKLLKFYEDIVSDIKKVS